MKTTLITLLSFLLISCGSVKKNKLISNSEGTEKTDFKESSGGTNKTQTLQNSSIRIENDGFNISVKPLNGQNSYFNFTSPDGQLFYGTTNAEINFEKKSEKKEVITNKVTNTVTTYWSQITYKSQTTYKTVTRYIDKYKEAYTWYYILLAGFMLREILRWLWNWFKKSNWYLKFINK